LHFCCHFCSALCSAKTLCGFFFAVHRFKRFYLSRGVELPSKTRRKHSRCSQRSYPKKDVSASSRSRSHNSQLGGSRSRSRQLCKMRIAQ
jgi:hypothetical protein